MSSILQFPIAISPALQLLLYTWRGGSAVNLFLLFYWIMELNQVVSGVVSEIQAVTNNIARASRFGDVLEATPEEALLPDVRDAVDESLPYIKMANVSVQLGKQTVLHEIDVEIGKGKHVAIVGTSGAGKSTLVSLLLGRHYATKGQLFVDGKLLDYEHLCQLRQRTAWIDPNMQLWNESLLYNLQYGTHQNELSDLLHTSIEQADLLSVLERMPHGLASRLGEAGRLVSGGEGQRVRFGRGLHRASAELVILDEAFRGIDRRQRGTLLKRARAYWKDKTLICVTHDISHTLDFERVLVMEQGRIIEDAHPDTLMAQSNSRYRTLLEEEEQVRVKLWENESWRHLLLDAGELTERTTRAPINTSD
jgi:ABC-type transport system involved in cytochrome bd biosynthesis fused ATPase/permease subunit